VKKMALVVTFLIILSLCSCTGNSVKILAKDISIGGTGDDYNVSPAKVEVTITNKRKAVEIPIIITNKDSQQKTFLLRVVSPISGEVSQDYTAYPVDGLSTYLSNDTMNIEGGQTRVTNLYITKTNKIPNTQVWVNVSVETNNQITSAYIVNILIKGDKK